MLSPTRELARQTEMVLLALGDYIKAKVFLVVGGEKVRDMMATLDSGVHIVVGKNHLMYKSTKYSSVITVKTKIISNVVHDLQNVCTMKCYLHTIA